jgi:hypothetical protein
MHSTREKDFGAHLFRFGAAFSFEGIVIFVVLFVFIHGVA